MNSITWLEIVSMALPVLIYAIIFFLSFAMVIVSLTLMIRNIRKRRAAPSEELTRKVRRSRTMLIISGAILGSCVTVAIFIQLFYLLFQYLIVGHF